MPWQQSNCSQPSSIFAVRAKQSISFWLLCSSLTLFLLQSQAKQSQGCQLSSFVFATYHILWNQQRLPHTLCCSLQAAQILASDPTVDAATVTPLLEAARPALQTGLETANAAASGAPDAAARIAQLLTTLQELGEAPLCYCPPGPHHHPCSPEPWQ